MPVRPMLLHGMALFLFDCFVKIWATCKNFLGKWFTVPPGRKLPVRICEYVHNEDQNGGRRQARQFFLEDYLR